MKKSIEKILRLLAKIIIKKYRPFIIGITGSVGKTSTKEAILLVLKKHFSVRASFKNYNNELGVPLTIINAKSQGKNIFGWLGVIGRAIILIFLPLKFPKVLILEMAADKPDDIKYLTSLASCQVGVLTSISPVHLEQFKNIENVLKEKQIIVTHLPPAGWAILNGDDERIVGLRNKIKAKILTFGFSARGGSDVGGSDKNDVKALEISLVQKYSDDNKLILDGLRFKLDYQGKIIPFFLPGMIAQHQLYSVLAGVAVGLAMNLNLLDIAESLRSFSLPAGRMKLIEGINDSIIIDDSYNASPEATRLALETLSQIQANRKIFVFGEMLELGESSEEAHREIGRLVVDKNIDIFLTIGELSAKAADSAKRKGMSDDKIFSFADPKEISNFLKEKILKNDVILIKGSQGSRMERVVKAMMAQPTKAKDYLVRQGKEWE